MRQAHGKRTWISNVNLARNLCCLFWLFFAFIAVAWGEEREQTHVEQTHVLLINSYHSGMDWTDGQVSGVRQVLEKSAPSVELHVEYMDSKRASDEIHLKNFRELLNHKYRNTQFAAIISTDNDAFDFLRQYRDQFFSDVPVVFSGVNFYREEMLAGLDGFTGVAETFEGGQTIGEMLRLHPKAQRIVVIIDNTTTGQATRNELSSMLVPFAEKISFEFWDYLSLKQLASRLPKLGQDTLVLLMPFSHDGMGDFVTYPQIANLVSQSSPVPVYGTWDFYMGYGIVGGRLTNAAAQGQAAARIVLRILAGEPPSQIPVTHIAPSEFQFDARQLHRFGISPAKLPAGSKVQFQSWDEIYRNWLYVGALLVILTLLAGWGWVRNYTLKRQTSMALQKSEARYRLIMKHSPTGILQYDRDLIVTYCNDRFAQIINTPVGRLFGLELDTLQDPSIIPALRRAAEGDSGVYEGEYVSTLSTARCEISMSCIPLGDTENEGAIAFVEDITERKNAETKLQQYRDHLEELVSERNFELVQLNKTLEARVAERTLALTNANQRLDEVANTDMLTGLPNRRYAMHCAASAWDTSIRERTPLACMMIDADGFKVINDTYGHDAGDAVLRALSLQLQHAVRNDDIVCRLGGDEFLVICTGTPLDGAMTLAESVRKEVAALCVRVGKGEWRGSISVGVAARTGTMTALGDLIKAADQGVYVAKRNGRNCVAISDQ
jgi:diguanylate cyclase (GGDEF)-like protein/PAS domain S-box-containing protein